MKPSSTSFHSIHENHTIQKVKFSKEAEKNDLLSWRWVLLQHQKYQIIFVKFVQQTKHTWIVHLYFGMFMIN